MEGHLSTENLIEDMLGFLESSSDDDDHVMLNQYEFKCQTQQPDGTESSPKYFLKNNRSKRSSIAPELLKLQTQYPLWSDKESSPSSKKLTDSIWRERQTNESESENDWNTKLESNCRRSGNIYIQEVHRAIYGDITGHPPHGSSDYFQAARNYALYGKDFLDFPENLAPLLSEKSSNPPETSAFVGASATFGNGLYPIPNATTETNNISYANFGQMGANTTYYQMCNGLQPSVRPVGNTAYGMFLGNKVTYVATAPTATPLVYNQHSSTTTNFISNSLANAALASTPAILYSNPMLTTTTQQYLNTFFKETQFLTGGGQQGTTGIYERLVYAQMLQQQIYQSQQQAAVAAMFQQHKPRPMRPTNSTNTNGNGAPIQQLPPTPLPSTPASSSNLCGRPEINKAEDISPSLVD